MDFSLQCELYREKVVVANIKRIMNALTVDVLLLLTMIFWASAYVGIRIGLHGYHPGSLALLRYSVASICMVVIYQRIPDKRAISVNDIPMIFLIGILGIGLYNIALNFAEIHVTSAVAGFVISLSPVLTTLLAVCFLKEKSSWKLWLGIAVSFLGVCLIAGENIHSFAYSRSLILLILAAMCSSLYTALQKPLLMRLHPIQFVCLAIWAGTSVLSVYVSVLYHDIQTAPWQSTLAVIYMGVFPGCIAYALWSYVLTKTAATKCAAALYLLPLMTLFLGWILLNEIPGKVAIVGGLMSLIGSYIASRSSK